MDLWQQQCCIDRKGGRRTESMPIANDKMEWNEWQKRKKSTHKQNPKTNNEVELNCEFCTLFGCHFVGHSFYLSSHIHIYVCVSLSPGRGRTHARACVCVFDCRLVCDAQWTAFGWTKAAAGTEKSAKQTIYCAHVRGNEMEDHFSNSTHNNRDASRSLSRQQTSVWLNLSYYSKMLLHSFFFLSSTRRQRVNSLWRRMCAKKETNDFYDGRMTVWTFILSWKLPRHATSQRMATCDDGAWMCAVRAWWTMYVRVCLYELSCGRFRWPAHWLTVSMRCRPTDLFHFNGRETRKKKPTEKVIIKLMARFEALFWL